MTTLFRVENQNSMQGLWYDANGNFRPLVTQLRDGKARDMPMEPDPEYGLGGDRWYSACESIPALSCVFSLSDIIELEGLGYSLYRFDVGCFRRNDWHALFTRQSVVHQNKIDIGMLKSELMRQEGA